MSGEFTVLDKGEAARVQALPHASSKGGKWVEAMVALAAGGVLLVDAPAPAVSSSLHAHVAKRCPDKRLKTRRHETDPKRTYVWLVDR